VLWLAAVVWISCSRRLDNLGGGWDAVSGAVDDCLYLSRLLWRSGYDIKGFAFSFDQVSSLVSVVISSLICFSSPAVMGLLNSSMHFAFLSTRAFPRLPFHS